MSPASSSPHAPSLDRAVSNWLLVCCALVFAMVVVGGVTRLTGSGLSMVDWRPVLGWLPPLSAQEWQDTFELYRQSPEFEKVNSTMDVEAFKGSFWLEYVHRLLDRSIGLACLLPFLFFLARGTIALRAAPRYLALFALGGLQGVLGWYMVKSGLVDDPRVSPYRLTAHLLMAVLILGALLWVALDGRRLAMDSVPAASRRRYFRWTVALTALVTVTLAAGGLVAGNKAGHAFNTFPMMGEYWVPPGLLGLEPIWRNVFENPVTVQFDHRLLAITTFLAVVAYWLATRRTDFPATLRGRAHGLLVLVLLQVGLGISTLLFHVPVPLASAHQAVGVLLFATALGLCHGLRRSRARDDDAPVIGREPAVA